MQMQFNLILLDTWSLTQFVLLKPNGKGVIMFANWPRNFKYKNYWTKTDIYSQHGNWYYNDEKYTIEMLTKLKYKNIKDLLPNFRDSLIYFEK